MNTKNWEGKVVDCDTSIAVGDRVRSYDFPDTMFDLSRPACYVEGNVVAIGTFEELNLGGHMKYKIRAGSVVFSGKVQDKKAEFYYPPVNGLENWLGGHTYGVVKVNDCTDCPDKEAFCGSKCPLSK